MAHKPNEKFVGAWLDPAEVERLDAMANGMGVSRSAVLRQLLDMAAGRVKLTQKTDAPLMPPNGHASQPTK